MAKGSGPMVQKVEDTKKSLGFPLEQTYMTAEFKMKDAVSYPHKFRLFLSEIVSFVRGPSRRVRTIAF